VIATHFHHSPDGGEIRQQQAQAILDTVQNYPYTLIMGDLNATPDTPEIALIREAGFTDILAGPSTGSGLANATFPSLKPERQIDYIWLTPDLTAKAITIPHTLASDHLAIVVTIQP
jgi:endonuclease/exonuclease/phosphatase family metal-dependent hydrolase